MQTDITNWLHLWKQPNQSTEEEDPLGYRYMIVLEKKTKSNPPNFHPKKVSVYFYDKPPIYPFFPVQTTDTYNHRS